MTMQSSNFLPALRELPVGESDQRRSLRDCIIDIASMDRAMYAAEFASAVSVGMWYVFGDDASRTDTVLRTDFPGTEINDSYLQAAYERTGLFDPDMPDVNVVDRWHQALANDEGSKEEFLDDLKGNVAEFNARDQLNQQGYNLELAADRYQRGWDLHGPDPDGEYVQIQVKAGDSGAQFDRTIEAMQETDYSFAVGSEINTHISENAPELADRIVADIGPDHLLVDGMEDGLEILSANEGIDIPDNVVDIVPYAAAIVGGVRLIYGALKTEREFRAADRTTKNRIQVVQTLTLMSRMGVSTVLATAGGVGGASAGSLVPGVGNTVAGIAGMVIGAGTGMYLNKHLQPHMLNLALNITGLTHDDLFYYKNKPRIDEVAFVFQTRARELAATPSY